MEEDFINFDDCFVRKGAGTGFYYCNSSGNKLSDQAIINRLESLAVPPDYDSVHYAKSANNYLQAIATDGCGRLQYFYHPDWRAKQQQKKFDHLKSVGNRLPRLRSVVDKLVNTNTVESNLDFEIACAIGVWILDRTFIRIGSAEYARDNDSYGLSTLRRRHADINESHVKLDFQGKSRVRQQIEFNNKQIANWLMLMSDLSGYEILKYINDSGQVIDITAGDINTFIRKNSGGVITAKDFRTWHAGVEAINFYETIYDLNNLNITDMYEHVANKLGNTVAVVRDYYIHPSVVDHIKSRKPIPAARRSKWLSKSEVIVKKIIN